MREVPQGPIYIKVLMQLGPASRPQAAVLYLAAVIYYLIRRK